MLRGASEMCGWSIETGENGDAVGHLSDVYVDDQW
jgi:hypothetical protein